LTVERKVAVLAAHCADAGRDLTEVRVTHLSSAVTASSRRELDAVVYRMGRDSAERQAAAERFGAGTVEDQIGRYRLLADAGVQTAIVALRPVAEPGALEAFGAVIAAFAGDSAEWPACSW
jgi:hypothetical protein